MPTTTYIYRDWEPQLKVTPACASSKDTVLLTASFSLAADWEEKSQRRLYRCFDYTYKCDNEDLQVELDKAKDRNPAWITVPSLLDGDYEITAKLVLRDRKNLNDIFGDMNAQPPDATEKRLVTPPATLTIAAARVEANLRPQRTLLERTDDQALWAAIRNRTAAIAFPRYQRFIDQIFCHDHGFARKFDIGAAQELISAGSQFSIFGPYAYGLLKLATQAFLTMQCGVFIRDHDVFGQDSIFEPEQEPIRFDDPSVTLHGICSTLKQFLLSPNGTDGALLYLDRIVNVLVSLDKEDRGTQVPPYCEGILRYRLSKPSMIELIWSYWLEEGMLVQTMNAIAWRFQNCRSSVQNPLGELEFDALRPLNNIIWGLIQDEHNRLTVQRRAYEYQHHYGVSLEGKAVSGLTPADTRSKFIETFHNLLHRVDLFYREDRDTTKIADAFPMLNALKEVHLILAEGAHNQFGDLTWTARTEMLAMQWMLARPEMPEFLRGRYMVPYQERWMGAVDYMKKLQGWNDTSIMHFYELAVTGERILLSVRYGDWADITNIEEQAKNWARNCKPEI